MIMKQNDMHIHANRVEGHLPHSKSKPQHVEKPCSYLRQYLKVNMIKITLNDSTFCNFRINILIKGENHNCKLIIFILSSSLAIKTRACTSRKS